MWVSDTLLATSYVYKHKCESKKVAIIAWFTTQAHFHMQG